MRIAHYIQDVRSRTEEEKQRAVFLWTFVFIVIIFIVWMVSFALSVANNSAEDAQLRAEASNLAAAKIEASKNASGTDTQVPFKGAIPSVVDFVNGGVDNVVNGFWVIGNMLHK